MRTLSFLKHSIGTASQNCKIHPSAVLVSAGRLLVRSCAARRLTRVHEGGGPHATGTEKDRRRRNGAAAPGTSVLGVADKGPDPSRGAQRMPAHIPGSATVTCTSPGTRGATATPRPLLGQSNPEGDEKKPLRCLFLSSARKRPNARIGGS